MNYQEFKLDVESRLGPAEYEFDRSPLNESARLLMEFRAKQMSDARAKKKLDNKNVDVSQQPESPVLDVNEADKALKGLTGFVPLEEDLKGFGEIEKAVLRVYLVNQQLEPKKLANSFGKTYQFIAGLLNSKAVMLLRSKYFHKQLDNNTKIGLLKLTEEADPKIVLAAAEYLKILHDTEVKDNGSLKLEDKRAEKALKLVGDWIAGDCFGELLIKPEDVV